MPYKGTPKLNAQKKAKIIAKKHLQIGTQKRIADSEGVSRATVNKLNAATVSPEVAALIPFEEQKLSERIVATRDKALQRLHLQLDTDDIPAEKLSTIFGTLYDKSRLEADKPTVITNLESTDTEKAIDLARQIYKKYPNLSLNEVFGAAVEFYANPNLEEVEREVLKLGELSADER